MMDEKTETAVSTLLRYLEAEGVKYIFGIPGGPLMPLYEAMFENGRIQPIIARHEEGAAFMADGYARVRRGLGVCCATTGPGATNALTGIACSAADSIPVLAITAQTATMAFGKGAAQECSPFGIDVVDLYKPVAKASLMLINADTTAETVRHCLRTALSGRPGPVHLNIPSDLMKKQVKHEPWTPQQYRSMPQAFERTALKEVAERLIRAKHPAFLMGHGVEISGAHEAARRLAEKLAIPVATTPKGKGTFPEDHLLSLGVFGFAGSPQSEAYILSDETDVLVTVGTSLGELATHGWNANLRPNTCLIQIDTDPVEIGKNYPAQLAIVGDANVVLTELFFQVERELRWKDFDNARPRDEDFVRKFKAQHSRCIAADLLEDRSMPLTPQRVMRELRQALPDDAIVFCDIGSCMSWALHYFPVYKPGTFQINLGFASMGHSIAAAIGGKLAAPDKPVISLVGDASFAMNGMEVHTAVENDIPVIWVVLNNSGHGMVHHGERIQFKGKFSTAEFKHRLDVAGLAKTMGADSVRIDKPDELLQALQQALKNNRPVVLDVRVNINALPPMGLRLATLDKFFDAPAVKEKSTRLALPIPA